MNMLHAAAHDVQRGSGMSCSLDCTVVAAVIVSDRIHLGCLGLLSLVRQTKRVCSRTSAVQALWLKPEIPSISSQSCYTTGLIPHL